VTETENILDKLENGDRRSIGRVDEVVADVLADPDLFDTLFRGILASDPLVRMRAADAVEKISADHPERLRPYKRTLIEQVAGIEQQEVRWHVAQMLPRLDWSQEEQAVIVEILLGYLDDESKIVKTFTMQALADFAARDANLRPRVVGLLRELTATGSPAMKSRGRKLLARLERTTGD
jgi:hypothetical protein